MQILGSLEDLSDVANQISAPQKEVFAVINANLQQCVANSRFPIAYMQLFTGAQFGTMPPPQVVQATVRELIWDRFYQDGEPDSQAIVPAQLGPILKTAIKKMAYESKQLDQIKAEAQHRFVECIRSDETNKTAQKGAYSKQHY